MSEQLMTEYPPAPHDHLAPGLVEHQLAGQQEQLFDPQEAWEVGHVALPSVVEIVESEPRQRPPEARAGEVAAELWQTRSPFNAENNAFYGSEQERQEAVAMVRGIAGQAQLTNKYFNGAHKRLGKQLSAGEISQDEHDEAVGGIVAEMALTKPEQLRQVAEAQRNAIDRRVKAGALPAGTEFVDVTSRVTENGVELAGIEAVVAKMSGSQSHTEFVQSGMDLKKEFYSEDNYIKAGLRHKEQQAAIEAKIVEAQRQAQMEVFHERTVREMIEKNEKNGDKED